MSHQVPTHVNRKEEIKLTGKETKENNPIGTTTQVQQQFQGL